MKTLHLDKNHPFLIETLEKNNFECHLDLTSSKERLKKIISNYEGLILRSRIQIDRNFIEKAKNLKFIARVGSGIEHIDIEYAQKKNIEILSSPEGNADSVGEHALGMLLNLFKNLNLSHNQIQQGNWPRKHFSNLELMGKVVGIIGYGYTGKAFAKRLKGFSTQVIFYDLVDKKSDSYAKKSSLEEIFKRADICSLHVSARKENKYLVNKNFIDQFKKPIYILNTARGECLHLRDLIDAMNKRKILGAGLDVLEYENNSFDCLINQNQEVMNFLKNSPKILLSPHVAGLTENSSLRLAKAIAQKILKFIKLTGI